MGGIARCPTWSSRGLALASGKPFTSLQVTAGVFPPFPPGRFYSALLLDTPVQQRGNVV